MPKKEDVGEWDITSAKKPVEGAFHFKLFDIQMIWKQINLSQKSMGYFSINTAV